MKIHNKFFKNLIVATLAICIVFQNGLVVSAISTPMPPILTRPPLSNPVKENDNSQQPTVQEETITANQAAGSVIVTTNNSSNTIFQKEVVPTQVFQNVITINQGTITLKVIDYPVVDLLNTVFEKINRKILISSNVREKISVQLNNATPEELLDLISMVTGLNWNEKNGVFLISTSDKLASTTFFPVKHGNLSEIKNVLAAFGLGNNLLLNTYPRGILVNASPGTLREIKDIIAELDKDQPSIKVEFQVVEINKSEEKKLGISWQDIIGSYNYTRDYGSSHPLFYATSIADNKIVSGVTGISKFFSTGILMSAQNIDSIGKILAQPYIITTNNSEAYLSTGDEIPIFSKDYNGNPTVEYKRVGIELFATPTVVEGDLLNINAKTVVNIISGQETQQGLTVPRISSREAKTTMNIKSGETIVIGGLIKEEDIKSINSVPFLSKLPFLGRLFRSTNKKKTNTEILIFITPTLINPVSKIISDDSVEEVIK